MTRFGKYLEKILADTGWDVTELAARVELQRVTVSRHLHGKHEPHFSTRKMYAAGLKIDVAEMESELKKIEIEVHAPTFTPSKYAGDPGELLRYKLQELVREGLTADEIIDEAMRMKGKK